MICGFDILEKGYTSGPHVLHQRPYEFKKECLPFLCLSPCWDSSQPACSGSSCVPPRLMFPHRPPCSDSALCCLVCGESLGSENWKVSSFVSVALHLQFLERKARHTPAECFSVPFKTTSVPLSTERDCPLPREKTGPQKSIRGRGGGQKTSKCPFV